MNGRRTSDELVVILASMFYDGHQLYEQRLARGFAARGDVLYVEPPVSVGKKTPEHGARTENISLFQPRMMPYGRRSALHAVSGFLVGLQIRYAVLRHKRGRAVRYVAVSINSHALKLLPRGDFIFLVKDDYSAGAELTGQSGKRQLRRFHKVMRSATKTVVVSPTLQSILIKRGVRSVVVPAGATLPATDLAEPSDMIGVPGKRTVFVGMISDRIDFNLLNELVAREIYVVLVGSIQNTFSKFVELEKLTSSEFAALLPARSGDELDAVITHCDVGLIPYEDSDFNKASFPLKALEYLACGKPVVSSELPAMRWLDFEHISIVSGPGDYAEATEVALAESRDPEIKAECLEFARRHSWESRVQKFDEIFRVAPGRVVK